SLTVTPPAPAAPIAMLDRGIVSSVKPSTTINVIANDRDPDGTPSKLTAKLARDAPASFALSGSTLKYTSPKGYTGVQRAEYTVTDDQGLTSATADIEIFVVNFSVELPWHNYSQPADVNADGFVSALDVSLIITELNLRKARTLPIAGDNLFDMFGFLDSYPDGLLTALDALRIINLLNSKPHGEASGESTGEATRADKFVESVAILATPPVSVAENHDMAFVALYRNSSIFEVEAERRRNR
ncbi:MAG: Ig-like domain-containing protein, partial [Aureliella sp.]